MGIVQNILKYNEIELNNSLFKTQLIVKEIGNVSNFDLGNNEDFGA